MNFGAFAGGFSGGFDNGVRQAKTIRDIIKERKLEDLRTQGMEEAKSARDAAVNGMVTTQPPAPPSADTPTPDKANPATQPPAVQAVPAPAPVTPAPMPPVGAAPPGAGASSEGNAGEAEAMGAKPPSVSTQAPAATETPPATTSSVAQPTPQTAAAAGVPGAAPAPAEKPVKMDGKFFVGGKGYATKEEAYKAADAATPSTMDFFMKTTVPKLQEAYVAAGDPAKAEAWGTWAATKQNQASMLEWSKMYRAAQMGDMEKAADHAFNLYKKMDDGITPVSKETVKDKEGNVTGFNVRLKNESTGEVVSQFIDKKGLIEMGLTGLAPDKLFEMTFKRQADADKAAMEARIKRGERVAQVQDNLIVKGYEADRADAREAKKGQQKLSEITLTKQLDAENMGARERAKAESKMEMLRGAGYTDEQINAMVPAIIGAGEHKKTTDPAERRALIASDLVKNDPTFSRLPVAERNKKVDEMMGVIYGDAAPKAASPAPAPATPGTPAAAAPGKPVYVKDTKTGEIFERRDGKLIPVKPGAPGQAAPAAGMPPR